MPFRIVRRSREVTDLAATGIKVVKDRRATDAEIGELYLETQEQTGLYVPELERYVPAARAAGRVALFTDSPEELAEAAEIARIPEIDE